jgi:HlyD family secretion protein
VKKLFLFLLVAIPLLVLGGWLYRANNDAPKVPFARAKRETLISMLPTNGKVEPIEWMAVRANAAGLVDRLPVKEGQRVAKAAVLAEMRAPGLAAELSARQAQVEQAQAELATIERGGKARELADIANSLARARLDHEGAQREYNELKRLEEKQAATHAEVILARGKVRVTEIELESLDRKRAALITNTDRIVAQGRLKEAEAALELTRRKIAETIVRAPIAGVLYSLPVRMGAYLNPGDLVANIGRLDRMRVRVYVDEPELGRVAVGLPVTIRWSALPGKQWRGTVEQMPAQVAPLGTRQVGEVLCTIENPDEELVPGTNVDAEIRSSTVEGALTIPKESLRRESTGTGVFILQGDAVAWRMVKTGISSVTRVQIKEGLSEGDAVALPSERGLRGGERVQPIFP